MPKVPLVSLSHSLAKSYGVLLLDGSGPVMQGDDGGDLELVCGQCGHVLVANASTFPPVLNGAARCNGCSVVAHLTRPSHYSRRVPMLANLEDREPPQEIFRIASVAPTLTCNREILEVSNGLIADFQTTQGVRPRLLFHYTSSQGFQGIIESGTIWASDIAFLNDTSEISHASAIISEEIAGFADAGSESVRELLRRANHPTNRNDLATAFLAICFCESGDLLSQWRAYGDGGKGYALGFDSFQFVSDAYYVRKVVYDPQRQRELVRRVLSDITLLFASVAKERSVSELDAELILPEFSALLSSHLEILLFSFKHPAFSEEGEWRLIIPFSRDLHLSQLKVRASGSLLVPYLSVGFSDGKQQPTLPLLEVVQGPSLHPELNKKAAHLLLERQRYEHVEVIGSETPLRA